MKRRTFYRLTAVLSLLGYAWLARACVHPGGGSPCLFRWLTGLPCPSCGATRALRTLLQGDVWQALAVNPLGLVLAALLAVVPVWLLADAVRRRSSLHRCYLRVEAALHRRAVFVPLAFIFVANWIWNILKGL